MRRSSNAEARVRKLKQPIRVCEATIADVPAMVTVRIGDAEAGPADPRMEAYLQGAHHPREALARRVAYLAFEREEPVGYIAGHLSNRFGCDGELQYLYVAQKHRRRGAAAALLSALARWFVRNDANRICVDVVPANEAARSFYYRHGAVDLKPSWLVWDRIGRVVEGTPASDSR